MHEAVRIERNRLLEAPLRVFVFGGRQTSVNDLRQRAFHRAYLGQPQIPTTQNLPREIITRIERQRLVDRGF